jgi:hypothetical protein
MFKHIADKNNWGFIDVRLSMVDSSDFLIPRFKKIQDQEITTYAIPEWAYMANQKPTLIFFDELNRAKLDVRNACLQMLLDRKLGQFLFNADVYFASAGNLGDEDGCEIEEFDLALKDRLATFKYTAEEESVKTWKEEFGTKNVNKYLVTFLERKPEFKFKFKEEDDNLCTYRSITMLSNLIGKDNNDLNDVINKISIFGEHFIGSASSVLLTYLNNMKAVTHKDIMNRFNEVKDIIKDYDRSRICDLIQDLSKEDYIKMKNKSFDNIVEFLKIIHAEERVSFITSVLLDSDKLIDVDYTDPDKAKNIVKDEYKVNKIKEFFIDDLVNVVNSHDSVKIEET